MVSNLGIIFLGGMCYKEIWPKAGKIRKALEELERWQWWEVREATSEVAPMLFLGRRPAGAGQVEAVGRGPAQVDLTAHRFAACCPPPAHPALGYLPAACACLASSRETSPADTAAVNQRPAHFCCFHWPLVWRWNCTSRDTKTSHPGEFPGVCPRELPLHGLAQGTPSDAPGMGSKDTQERSRLSVREITATLSD